MSDRSEDDSYFGYERVAPSTKTARVRAVFDSVASRYDLMNDLMSGGLHRLWKRFAVALLDARAGQRVLDLAGGTGDIARLVAKRRAQVLVCDINAHMLARGRDRAIDGGQTALLHVQANAEALPLPATTVDRVIVGFGLRNVTHKQQALAEIERVLRPGGRVVVLEFSQPRSPWVARAYDLYSFKVLPTLGRWVAKDADSYRYLAESIRMHPDQESLKLMLEQAGFAAVRYYNIMAGIVAIHVGWKL